MRKRSMFFQKYSKINHTTQPKKTVDQISINTQTDWMYKMSLKLYRSDISTKVKSSCHKLIRHLYWQYKANTRHPEFKRNTPK